MQKIFLERAVSGAERALYADENAAILQSYHHYVDELLSDIGTLERYNYHKQESQSESILYVGQKWYGKIPSHESTTSSVSKALHNLPTLHTKPKLQNRFLHCWAPGCLVRACKQHRSPDGIKRNLKALKKMKSVSNIQVFTITALCPVPEEVNEIFLASSELKEHEENNDSDTDKRERMTHPDDPSGIHFTYAATYEEEENISSNLMTRSDSD